jgi:hypothetical protein
MSNSSISSGGTDICAAVRNPEMTSSMILSKWRRMKAKKGMNDLMRAKKKRDINQMATFNFGYRK